MTRADERVRLVHLTTTDMSLELLLGPQLSAFVEAGYDVIGMSAPGDFVEAVEARGVRHVPLAHATRAMAPHHDAAAVGELWRRFRELTPSIVHTHNPKPGLYGRLAAKAAGVPVIVNTVHGLYALPTDPLPKRAVVWGLERMASICSDAELVQNVEDIAILRRLRVPAGKLRLLGNGIDLDRFGHSEERTVIGKQVRVEWNIPTDAVVVGAVGRLVLEKGYLELFRAWDRVHHDHPEAILAVVGPRDDAKSDAVPPDVIDRAERSGVRFLGHRHDIERCYQAMDMYVLASHREGFPRSAMEAAASGVPVLATDIRGCRQVVNDGETGVLVPPRTSEPLARAITTLIEDPDLRRTMGAAGVVKARREFDQQAVIDLSLETYSELLARPSG